MTNESPIPTTTPWGEPQQVKEFAPGIINFSTASHGGFYLSPERVAEMPPSLREFNTFAGANWYEEDVDWAIVVLAFPKPFTAEDVQHAHKTLKHWKPELYERFLAENPSMQKSEIPTIAHADDIDRELSHRAYHGTSFSPERRGDQDRKDYADTVNGLYAELWPAAKTDEQKAVLADEMERYRQGYAKRLTDYLHSHSNVVSTMIAGPANFPVARMQKRGQWADNKVAELIGWEKRARAAIKQRLLDARPEEEKQAAAWRAVERDIKGSLSVIEAIDAGTSPYTRSAFVNSIAGKAERLANNGEIDLVEKSLALVREYNAAHKKPAISERHGFWKFGELARQKAQAHDAALSEEPSTIVEAEGVRIVENKAADRVQIFFPDKPDAAMRDKLKGEGWRWSPSEEAWQRKLTANAIYSAKRITGLGE